MKTGASSLQSRSSKKLLTKSNWFKQKSKEDLYEGAKHKRGKKRNNPTPNPARREHPKTVLFCEYTPDGELAKKLRELFTRLQPLLEFGIKVVKKAGTPLKAKFPTNMWEGTPRGRYNIQPGAEHIPPCTMFV